MHNAPGETSLPGRHYFHILGTHHEFNVPTREHAGDCSKWEYCVKHAYHGFVSVRADYDAGQE